MGRQSRRPLYSIVVLLCVTCAIYFVATGDKQSLGQGGPLTSLKLRPETELVSSNMLDLDTEKLTTKPKYSEEVLTHLNGEAEDNLSEEDPDKDLEKDFENDLEKDDSEKDTTSEAGANGFTETPFMPKMANETLKAQLGNSAWHLFHTVLARYPDKPTPQEKSTLKQYIHLFAQVYPCGDCARHFQKLLQKYPVQVETRKTAALWGCHIHNKVNERLEKPEYDCTTILEDYDCGCGSDEKEEDSTLGNETAEHLRKVTIDEKADSKVGG